MEKYINNLRPIEKGNAKIMNEVCLPAIPFVMLRYESISHFYTDNPKYIRIRLKDGGELYVYEQVLRIRFWIPNQRTDSWCIFSEDREWENENDNIGGLIIRHAVWDRGFDKEKLEYKEYDKKGLCEALVDWPKLILENTYLTHQNVQELITNFKNFDEYLSAGIRLSKGKKEVTWDKWREIEVFRQYNWGVVHSIWGPPMMSQKLELSIKGIIDQLAKCIANSKVQSIYQMDLDYMYPPDLFKDLINGAYIK